MHVVEQLDLGVCKDPRLVIRCTNGIREAGGVASLGKPGVGLEPTTPSLPWKCSTS